MTLQIKNSPYKILTYLDSLLIIARKKGRRETTLAIDALREAFINDLLPSDRRLRHFSSQPWISAYVYHTHNPNSSLIPSSHPFCTKPSDTHLAMWALECGIKSRYSSFIEVLEEGTHDTLAYIKRARIVAVYELLRHCPEAENVLLGLMVNKMGDSDRKIAANSQHQLMQLLDKNPGMKIPVVKEVERLLFRPHIKQRAQYYALCFMNQLLFGEGESLLAQAMVGIYFTLFKVLATNAIPSLADEDEKKKAAKAAKFGKGKRDRKRDSNSTKKVEKTLEPALSKKMLGAILSGINRALPYALKNDDISGQGSSAIEKVLDEQTEMLFSIAGTALDDINNFSLVVQSLSLLYFVSTTRDLLRSRFYVALYQTLLAPGLANSSKLMLFMNLLFKAMKNDPINHRVLAFTKRLLQICTASTPEFICASLFLISEVAKSKSSIDKAIKSCDTVTKDVTGADDEKEQASAYDPNEADPEKAKANMSALWELRVISNHFHPSVARFAEQVLTGETIVYAGNPLTDFTRSAFLNRFVNKNPKPRASHDRTVTKHRPAPYVSLGGALPSLDANGLPVIYRHSEHILGVSAKSLAPDEQFMQVYVREKRDRVIAKKQEEERRAAEQKELDSDDEEEYATRLIEREMGAFHGDSFIEDEVPEGDNLDISDDGEYDFADEEDIDFGEVNFDDNMDEINEDDEEMELEEPQAKRSKTKGTDYTTYSATGAFDDDDDDDSDSNFGKVSKNSPMFEGDDDVLSDDDDDDDDMLAQPSDVDENDDNEGIFSSTFASADDFAELLEDSGVSANPIGDARRELLLKHGLSSRKYGKSNSKAAFKAKALGKPENKPKQKTNPNNNSKAKGGAKNGGKKKRF